MLGEVRSTREAVLRLKIFDSAQHPVEVDGVIDTGFTEHLTLPSVQTSSLNLKFEYATGMELADGSIVEMKVYSVQIEWNGSKRTVSVHEAEGSPLIGMSLLYGCRLTMDVLDGGSVTIEAIS